jgi:hypothetical protein
VSLSRLIVPLALAAAAALAGCGGSGEHAAKAKARKPPAGYALYADQHASFFYPTGWKVSRRSDGQGGTVVNVTGPLDAKGLAPQIALGETPNYRSGFANALRLNELNAKVRFAHRRVVSRRTVAVRGAAAAHLTVATYGESGPSNQFVPPIQVRTLDLVALSSKRTAINLFARSPLSDLPKAPLNAILRSLEVAS